MDQPVLSFRSSFWVVWRSTTYVLGAWALVVSVWAYLSGWEIHLAITVGSLAGSLTAGLLLALAVVYLRVYVTADGIRCYDASGVFYHFAPWPTIERVRPLNVLGLRYLMVQSSATRRELCVPLFLTDMPGFRAAIADRAGPDHPLTEALQGGR
ncbi:MAG: hypothetical protein HYS12_15525 [Planctomycetes bacterium]|nr:hypothetical protein [Planctomycetota bacterium]